MGVVRSTNRALVGLPNEGKMPVYPGDTGVMLGNSITTDMPGSNYYWWKPLRDTVDAFYATRGLPGITWINEGEGGATTGVLLATYMTRVVAHNPDFVIIEIGVNDPRGLSEAQSVANLTALLDGIRAALPNVRIMLLTAAFTEPPEVQLLPDATWDSLAVQWRNIARARGIPCVDLRGYFNEMTALEQASIHDDGVHPNNPEGRAWFSMHALHQINMQERRP
jgi:lysophospholipase L1-like esterase